MEEKINIQIEKMALYAPVIVRIGLALVFLWFGSSQIIDTSFWGGFIPDWVVNLSHLSATTLVHFNAGFEIVFGLCLLAGYFTRVVAFFLALHLLDIMFTMGYTSIGVRDFGLSLAAISVFLNGADVWSLDTYLEKKSLSN
jgi:uncharacterized membrane protein YphA (DoxX/SURF4 family)